MADSDQGRLSVAMFDVAAGHEEEFFALAREFDTLLALKAYGHSQTTRDEAHPLRFYAVRYWTDAAAAEACHADSDAQALAMRLAQIARVISVVNGARRQLHLVGGRPQRIEPDRRTGFDRRQKNAGHADGDRRATSDRRLGPRRLRERPGEIDLVAAARRAREHAEAGFSHFKVGAALEASDGTVITGCNIENATYGLTICAERVAMFKAISEGHREFTRVAIVADTEAPTPPCGACRQILWEFGGNVEVVLANMQEEKGRHRLIDLLPLPFDARLL